jgi:hypothetical protein
VYLDTFECVLKLNHPLFSNILIKSVCAVKTEITLLSTELEIRNNNGVMLTNFRIESLLQIN